MNFSLLPFYEIIKLKQSQGNSPLASYWHWTLITCQERGALLLICLLMNFSTWIVPLVC